MKKIFFLFSLFSFTSLFAQKELSNDYSYSVSNPYKVFDASRKLYFSKGNQTLAIKIDEKETAIQKFDSEKPAFIKEKKYEKFFPKNHRIEDVLELDTKYYVFYSSWNGKDDKEQLFAVEVDFEKGEFLPNPKLIFEIDGKILGKSFFTLFKSGLSDIIAGTQDKFDLLCSRDKKKLLVQYRKKKVEENENENYDIGLVTFDSNLNKLAERKIKNPYTDKKFILLDYQLDIEGNLYILSKTFHDNSFDEKKPKDATIANYHIEVFFIGAKSDEIKISRLENNEKFISDLWVFDSTNDVAICGGFYSNGKENYNDCDGIIVFKIDNTGRIFEEYYHEIPNEIINQYESKKTLKENKKKVKKGEVLKMKRLVLKDLVQNGDGSFILIGEQYYISYSSSSGPNARIYTKYNYDNILVAKIGLSGELNWMKKIPKKQMGSKALGGMSYFYFETNGTTKSHYLLFLDNVKNIDLSEDQAPVIHSDGFGGYLTSVKISDSDGSFTKASILNGREIEDFQIHQFATSRVFKVDEDSFMFEVYKKKKEDVMIRVDIK